MDYPSPVGQDGQRESNAHKPTMEIAHRILSMTEVNDKGGVIISSTEGGGLMQMWKLHSLKTHSLP